MLVTPGLCARTPKEAAASRGEDKPVPAEKRFDTCLRSLPARLRLAGLILLGLIVLGCCSPPGMSQSPDPPFVTSTRVQSSLPPRAAQAQRFLARRGLASGQPIGKGARMR